jgi:hypothetical protein
LGGLDGFGKRRSRRRHERRFGGWEEKRECGFRATLIILGGFFAEFPSVGFEGRKRFLCFDFWVVVSLFVGAAGGTRSIISSSSSSSRRREKKNPSVVGGELEVENGPPCCCCFGGVEKACRRAEERQCGEKSIRGLVREEEEEEEKEESGLARERERDYDNKIFSGW